jgi:hypothetical protein
MQPEAQRITKKPEPVADDPTGTKPKSVDLAPTFMARTGIKAGLTSTTSTVAC